jgi:hypothetical protein
VKVIFRQEPSYSSATTFGSRIVFARDGSLFVTLGDRYSARDEAQNPANHLGKLVRLMSDGSPYAGNPKKTGWRPEIWSIGHRNVQGAALHPQTGKLWTIEHGARGGDEINVPEAGKNYGWPVITYGRDYSFLKIGEGTAKPGLEQPIYYWDPFDRPIRRGVLHRRPASPSGRATCSSAHSPARRCTAWCSTVKRSWARRSCSPISANASAMSATAPTVLSGC